MKYFKAATIFSIFCLNFASPEILANETPISFTPVWVKINITNNSYFFWNLQNSTITNSTFEGSNVLLKPQATIAINIYPVFNSGDDQHLVLDGDLNYSLENSADGCNIAITCKGWNRIDAAGFGCLAERTASVSRSLPDNSYSTTCSLTNTTWDPTTGLFTANVVVNAANKRY